MAEISPLRHRMTEDTMSAISRGDATIIHPFGLVVQPSFRSFGRLRVEHVRAFRVQLVSAKSSGPP